MRTSKRLFAPHEHNNFEKSGRATKNDKMTPPCMSDAAAVAAAPNGVSTSRPLRRIALRSSPLPSALLLLLLVAQRSVPPSLARMAAAMVPPASPDPEPGSGYDYTRYERYPPYCSAPEEMERRAVPPLQGKSDGGVDTRLVHVTALIRHGARTPYAGFPEYQCWNGYWTNPETGVWNCQLTTLTSPPTDVRTAEERGEEPSRNFAEPDFLFEKHYDALTIDGRETGNGRTGNKLHGTCQLGQLLLQGYDQEMKNGLHLREAFFYDGKNTTGGMPAASDARMRLWDLTKSAAAAADGGSNINSDSAAAPTIVGDESKKPHEEPNLRYRADDGQRTLMSGQVLLRGLFGPELASDADAIIKLHTADYGQDVLVCNARECPRLSELEDVAESSDEYAALNETGAEVAALSKFWTDRMGQEEIPESILDCLMTTVCTDRPLPDALNDYDGFLGTTDWEPDQDPTFAAPARGGELGGTNRGSNGDGNGKVGTKKKDRGDASSFLDAGGNGDKRDTVDSERYIFERLVNLAVKKYNFRYKYDDAAYAKLGMGPLWQEIMANILPIVRPKGGSGDGAPPPPKMALFSGHDTTLMPILATLGPHVWSGTNWAPYASMILIEIHRVVVEDGGDSAAAAAAYPSGYAFRLVYNGEVLTPRMDGCANDSDLCDAGVLADRVAPFAKYKDRDCALSHVAADEAPPDDENGGDVDGMTEGPTSNPRGVAASVLQIVLSAAMGGVVTYFAMRWRDQKRHHYGEALRELTMSATDDVEYNDEVGGGFRGENRERSREAARGSPDGNELI